MNDKYLDFNEKRMHIFGELVKRYWTGKLNKVSDLNELADDIMKEYGFDPVEKTFILDHIRLAMGQAPTGRATFGDELDMVKSSGEISKPVVAKIEGPCEYCDRHSCECVSMGKYETLLYSRTKDKEEDDVDGEDCLECGYCASTCDFGSIAEKIEFLPIVDLLKENKNPVFAAVAPAIVGQFGDKVTMGKLRTAFKIMGFEDMIEIALFADILTIKEAFEFNKLVKNKEDFFLTSCCCPVWFNMIKKNYPDIYEHLSPSVSPMIASGRILKRLYPDAKVVFISPCIAKKSEALEPDLKGAIDYVINFRELQEIFAALELNLEELSPLDKDHASLGGRLYARKGGVSFSVKTVVNRLEPSRVIKLKSKRVDGVKECRAVLDALTRRDDLDANFIEGMGCTGGCVGGPRTNIDTWKATALVNEFGEDSFILTPFDNLNVMKILKQLGLSSIEEITKNNDMKRLLSRD